MHICKERSSGLIGFVLGLALLGGCASPGPPLPPSLELPQVVTDLSASRAGNAVTLRWTTPSRTTDKLPIAGPIMAEICRETLAAPPIPASAPTSGAKVVTASPCAPVVQRLTVVPGESEVADPLPSELASGPHQALAYRVQLRNAAGRTAGASGAVFSVSGEAPAMIDALRAQATKAGVVLQWQADASTAGAEDSGSAMVELDRTTLEAPPPARAAAPSGALGTPPKEPAEIHMRVGAAGAPDPGGTIDRTAQIGHTYRYTAQRVRTVVVGTQTLEQRSLPSASVVVTVRDVFPPDAPAGLVAAPAFTGPQDATGKPAIDLSWEPDMEPHLAGYKVYRRALEATTPGAWQPLGSELVTVPAYRDLSVTAGQRYAYRVTAVDSAARESTPSEEATETAPPQ
jgi:hypothetical protein